MFKQLKPLKPDSLRNFYLPGHRLKISGRNQVKTISRYLTKLHIQSKIHSLLGSFTCMETDTPKFFLSKRFLLKTAGQWGRIILRFDWCRVK